jgi:signal transduction histidine kinase
VVAQTESEARQAGATVEVTSDEALTSGDALLLERLVHNLVENGVRHNTGDGGWVGVACRSRPDLDRVELQVSNTGPVIRPYEIPTLFEPFRRLGAERLVTGNGAGLGLSIVRSVARAHGGEVIAEPREDGGLVVTVRLPRYRDIGGAASPSHDGTADVDADR